MASCSASTSAMAEVKEETNALEPMESIPKPRLNLSKEQETALFEILRCAVCLEIPKGRPPRVQTCENGHHFCLRCHTKLETCAVCRGSLLPTRNFVVEEIISKFAVLFGIVKPFLKTQPAPYAIGMGKFPCPMECGELMPGVLVLKHMRSVHCDVLVDNIRSNVYNLCLEWKATIKYEQNAKCIFCLQVSDMGLLKIKISFSGPDLQGRVHVLRREEIYSAYKFRMTLKHSKSGFFLEDTPVCGWFPKEDSPAFNIPSGLLPLEGTDLEIFATISRVSQENILHNNGPIEPTDGHKIWKSRARNERKKRIKARKRAANTKEMVDAEKDKIQLIL